MKLQRVRFEGALRFPGVSGDTPTFNTDDGFDIETDRATVVTVSRGDQTISVPWSRVMEGVHFPPAPVVHAPPMQAGTEWLSADETAPQPATRARRGRLPKTPAAG